MTALLITAFIMGGIGSLHCVGMCGPIALALPVVSNNNFGRFLSTLLYNLGRMVTYAALGALLGLAGASFALAGFQKGLSVLLGLTIIVVLLWPKHAWVLKSNHSVQLFFATVRNSLGKLLARRNYRSVFFIGLVNGLLPCGLVYIALAGAVATTSVVKSSLFMAAFGLGTLPLMWGISFFGSFINVQTRVRIRKAYPYLMAGMACLLIIRGMGLDIPFISPALHTNEAQLMPNGIECYKIK
jgi:sulfite exporter TauE/SafE